VPAAKDLAAAPISLVVVGVCATVSHLTSRGSVGAASIDTSSGGAICEKDAIACPGARPAGGSTVMGDDVMRCMWFLGFASVVVIPTWGAAGSPDEEVRLLQGEWVVVAIEDEGHKASEDELKGMQWSINGTTITATQPGLTGKMRFTLNPKKTPKEIDLTPLDGNLKGTVQFAIYDLQDGRLRVCYREPKGTEPGRPRTFETPPNSGCGMIELEKKMK
jgi:uncharacterized protein (TIGR03067 family)